MQPIASKFTALLSQAAIDKVIEVASSLKIEANWLLAVMYFETAYSFSPAKTNNIGSVGLIQFTRDKAGVSYKTIGGKRYELAALGKMDFIQQMDVVHAYYKEAMGKRKVTSFIDTYLVTFFPAALGQADGYVLQTSGLSASLIAKQNPVFDANSDGKIEKKEVVDFFRKIYNAKGFNFDKEINFGGGAGGTLVAVFIALFFCTCYNVNETINLFF